MIARLAKRNIRKKERAKEGPGLSTCETVTAGPGTRNHLRVVAAGEELKTGGGLRQKALCGTEVAWDLRRVDDAEIEDLSAAGWICNACKSAQEMLEVPVVADMEYRTGKPLSSGLRRDVDFLHLP